MTSGDLKSDGGFSLVEIMVALFIVGLASSLVIVNIPRTPTPLEAARRQIEELLSTSMQLADLSGEPYGVVLEESAVLPLVFREGEWRRPVGYNAPKIVRLHDAVRLTTDDLEQPRFQTTEDEEEVVTADLWFDPSGLATETEFELDWDGNKYVFNVSQAGKLDIQNVSRR
ncbi:MAG: hypothetical protein CMK09_14725 [Ponticaulis sp.]|nr:hypothetical protein [Ponticaulis sp.]